MTPAPGFQVDVHGVQNLPLGPESVERAVRHVLEADAGEPAGEVSVAFLADDAMAELNGQYLAKEGPTDVLAFRLGGRPEDDWLVGDVYVGAQRAGAQAQAYGVLEEEELLRLVIHGVLHVTGHDHPDGPDRERSPMFQRQEALLREILEAEGRTG